MNKEQNNQINTQTIIAYSCTWLNYGA